ncbi:double zinc ribbon domain-containing protein [Curvibacter lanceolatus]|uniref:double zinc ribbon domain-containing protein n=1 Tax=Curvibacter lanceolatus TaxID=86182 RepID=UPI00316AE48D
MPPGGVPPPPPAVPRVACPTCRTANAPSARFCQQCGGSLTAMACTQCGTALQPGAKFCGQCGKTSA